MNTNNLGKNSADEWVPMGATTDSTGAPAGNAVLSSGNNSYVTMQVGGTNESYMLWRTSGVTIVAGTTTFWKPAILGLYIVVNPTSATAARDAIYAGNAQFLQPGKTGVFGAGGDAVTSVVICAVGNLERNNAFDTATKVAGSIQFASTKSTTAKVTTIMTTFTPVSTIKGVEISNGFSNAAGPSFADSGGNLNADMLTTIRGIA